MALNELLQAVSLASQASLVRVSVSREVAHNLDAMQKVTRNVLGKLGCEACHSGFDIRYDVLRDFIADERGEVRAAGQPG